MDICDLLCETVMDVLKEEYSIIDTDEIMEYMWLKPRVTNLNVDIFIDDGGSYKRNKHSLLVFVRNGYEKTVNEFIPFKVDIRPIIMDTTIEYNISYNDIFAVQEFIFDNMNLLIKMANKEISHNVFIANIQKANTLVAESFILLNEMANDSKLPMDIWLDEGGTYKRHAPRLKFRASFDQKKQQESFQVCF